MYVPLNLAKKLKLIFLKFDSVGASTAVFIAVDAASLIGTSDEERFEVVQYRVVEDQDALDATDYSPIYADIDIF